MADIEARIDQSVGLVRALRRVIGEPNLSADIRTKLSAGCAKLALQHHSATVLLISKKHYGSATSLMRVQCEAFIRSAWLDKCANEDDLKSFMKPNFAKSLRSMVRELEGTERFGVGVLQKLIDENYPGLCDFTHTGVSQVARHLTEGPDEPVFDDEELCRVLDASDTWAELTAKQVAALADNGEMARHIHEYFDEYFRHSTA